MSDILPAPIRTSKTGTLNALEMQAPNIESYMPLIQAAMHEDLADLGDISSQVMRPDATGKWELRSRQNAVFCGGFLAEDVIHRFDPKLQVTWNLDSPDGSTVLADQALAEISGPVRPMLTAERTLLNFLQRLSGIATLTRRFVESISGTEARIYDTRKTTPGWRSLEKFAVRCGGGCNHRMGLYDAVLIKDNHLAEVALSDLQRTLSNMVAGTRSQASKPEFVAVEVDTLEQFEPALKVAGIDVILLDNFSTQELSAAVALRNQVGTDVELEASGGVNLENVAAIAATGVERISTGAITFAAPAVDLGLDQAHGD